MRERERDEFISISALQRVIKASFQRDEFMHERKGDVMLHSTKVKGQYPEKQIHVAKNDILFNRYFENKNVPNFCVNVYRYLAIKSNKQTIMTTFLETRSTIIFYHINLVCRKRMRNHT